MKIQRGIIRLPLLPPRPPEPPKPLVRRCPCGQRISSRRHFCLSCYHSFLREIASQIFDQTTLDAVIQKNFADNREEVLAIMTPHLGFQQQAAEPAT